MKGYEADQNSCSNIAAGSTKVVTTSLKDIFLVRPTPPFARADAHHVSGHQKKHCVVLDMMHMSMIMAFILQRNSLATFALNVTTPSSSSSSSSSSSPPSPSSQSSTSSSSSPLSSLSSPSSSSSPTPSPSSPSSSSPSSSSSSSSPSPSSSLSSSS